MPEHLYSRNVGKLALPNVKTNTCIRQVYKSVKHQWPFLNWRPQEGYLLVYLLENKAQPREKKQRGINKLVLHEKEGTGEKRESVRLR